MLVLGIDPGIGTTGCALIHENHGFLSLVKYKAINTDKKLANPERLVSLYENIMNFLAKEKIDAAVLETLFFNTNITTAFSVGQAKGVVLFALAQAKISIFEFNPIEVKMALTGYGRASKSQIQKMVTQILHLKKNLTPDDVADAAALALTYCFTYKLKRLSL